MLDAICNVTGVRVMSIPIDQDALLRALKAGKIIVETAWGE